MVNRSFHFDVEIAAVEVSSLDAIAVVSQFARGERNTAAQLEPFRRRQLSEGDMAVAGNLNFVDQGLRALLNLEGNIDFWLAIGRPGSYFHIFVAAIVI